MTPALPQLVETFLGEAGLGGHDCPIEFPIRSQAVCPIEHTIGHTIRHTIGHTIGHTTGHTIGHTIGQTIGYTIGHTI